jgi:uncharacterized membrane protein
MSHTGSVSRRHLALRSGRLEGFSDGIFAFAITLLVLDVTIPVRSSDLLRSLGDEWPVYLAYFVSFATIGSVWLSHTVITEYLDHADQVLMRLNLLLLLVVSFLPFPTRLVATYHGQDRAERVAVTIYGANLLLTCLVVSLLWHYATREDLIRGDAADDEIRFLTRRLNPALVAYGVLIVLGLFSPWVAVAGYLVLAFYFIVPIGLVRRRRR